MLQRDTIASYIIASIFFSVHVGVSYRKGIEYSEDIRIAGFLLPSIHIESLPYVEFV